MDLPPAVPNDATYTSHWCEENIYLIIQSFYPSQLWDIFVLFISNHTKTVALWSQKLAKEPGLPVVWDYHVIAVLRPRADSLNAQTWVYDFDTQLGIPVLWDTYFSQTFSLNVPYTFQSIFRVVPAQLYLDTFASDRSHMLDTAASGPPSNPTYFKPLPPYPPLRGQSCIKANVTHNLMEFVSMLPSDGHGEVFSIHAVRDLFGSGIADRES